MPDQHCSEKFALIGKVTEVVMSSDTLSMAAHRIIDLVVSYWAAGVGSVMLVDHRMELSILSSRGLDNDLARDWRGKVGQGVSGSIAAAALPVLCTNTQTDPRFNDFLREPCCCRTFIACPIVRRDRVLGLVNVMDANTGQGFVDEDLDLLRAISGQVALAFEKAVLVSNFQQKIADVEEANRRLVVQGLARIEYLTRVSHELRTPLNAIRGAVHLLQNTSDVDSDQRHEFQDIMAHETERLLAMVNRQLDFLRIEDESRILREPFLSLASFGFSVGSVRGAMPHPRERSGGKDSPGDLKSDDIH